MEDRSPIPSAAQRWRAMIEEEHAQSDRRRDLSIADQWTPFAGRFRPAPESSASEDPQFQAIVRRVRSEHTVLDVGAGGGRLAVPLAQQCRRVIAVEPSESMIGVLRASAAEAGVTDKITVIPSTWEEAQTERADIVLCSHVLYTVRDVVPFARKLEEHASELVMAVLFAQPPIAHAKPFWERVHQEERLQLPGLPEFVQVLWEAGIYPDVEMLPTRRGGRFGSWEEARDVLRARLYVRPGTPEDDRLEIAMRDLLVAEPDGACWVRDLDRQRPGLVTWAPERAVG